MKSAVALAICTLASLAIARGPQAPAPHEPPVKPIVEDYASYTVGPVPARFGYDPAFYRKYADAHGIPVISSEKVPDAALLIARDIVVYMLANRPDIRREMIAKGYRVGIMAITEMTTDIPEQRDRRKPGPDDRRLTRSERENYDKPGGIGSMTDKEYWDRRARGQYKGHYAETNAGEYWAEGTQWWFWSNYEWFDGDTRLQTPDDLLAYDPRLFELLGQVYPGHHIPADVYHARNIRPQPRRVR